jgi:hypothetical protein
MKPALLARLAPVLVLLALAAPAVHAEEAPNGDTPAEKAFRDAWWAETAGGDLTKALALYEQSARGEGPAAVRARAHYHRAAVLHRLGRTEEAIRELERLAQQHPGETALQADARARLTEWTAVDLRTGFPEWYRRFQYGPEFQAKVVDLVLKLGVPSEEDQRTAERELLTIGDPAVAALRAHLASRNEWLARNAVEVLLKLGVVPDEIVTAQPAWADEKDAWKAILTLPPERRQALRSRLPERPYPPLAAALGEPAQLLEWLAAKSEDGGYPYALLRAFLGVTPPATPLADGLVAVTLDERSAFQSRFEIGGWLVRARKVDAALMRRWNDAGLSALVESHAHVSTVWTADEAWAELLRRPERSTSRDWVQALERLLPHVAWPASRDQAVEVFARTWRVARERMWPTPEPTPRLLEVVGLAIDRRIEPSALEGLLGFWRQNAPGTVGEQLQHVRRWLAQGLPSQARLGAQQFWFERAHQEDLGVVVDYLVDPAVSDGELGLRWQQFFQGRGPPFEAAVAVLRAPELLQRLLDRVPKQGDEQAMRNMASPLIQCAAGTELVPALVERQLAAPERFPVAALLRLWSGVVGWMDKQGRLGDWRRGLRERWPTWTKEQRGAALEALVSLQPQKDDEMTAFLRARLAARPLEFDLGYRNAVLSMLPGIDLALLASCYDLSQPADADEASWRLSTAPKLEPTPEAFEALRLVFRPDGRQALYAAGAFDAQDSLLRPLTDLLLAHDDTNARSRAMTYLMRRSSPEDAPLWTKALADPHVNVRVMAAKGIERVPTPVTLKALVAALDDPHPDVRAAALASLDAIQKMEDLKARWKERVR